MKHSKRFCRWLLCTLLCLCLAGCSMPGEQVQVEELLRAPKLSGDYGDVQTALNDWLGESAQLKYPMQGDLLSPFLIHDLDGDGQQDAAVLYTTAQSSNVCVAILQKGSDGMWQVRQNAEGLADTVDSVGLAQLQPGDASQLVVGYVAAQGDHYLAVYSYTDGELSTILEQQYQQYLVEDITGGGSQDLILMSTLEDGGVQIELLTVDKEGSFQQVAVMGLSADRFSGCASVAAGLGAESGLTFPYWAALFLTLVGGICQMIAGIKGIKHSKRSEKAGKLIVWGVIVAVFSVLSIVMSLVNGGEFNVVSILTGIAIPALYIYGAVLNSKADTQ